MVDDLERALDGVYRAFEKYERPEWIEGCACCWDGEPVADDPAVGRGRVRVRAIGGDAPLRQVLARELRGVACDVPLTCGSLEVWKHYLPRILEVAVGEGFDWPDLEVVVGHLSVVSGMGIPPWTEWPAAERLALQSFFHALWTDRLTCQGDEAHEVDDALCAIGRVEPDLGSYLDEWLRFEHPNAAANLGRFFELNADDMARGELHNAFWGDDKEPVSSNRRAVVAWAAESSTRDAVAAAVDRARTSGEAAALTRCLDSWSAMRRNDPLC